MRKKTEEQLLMMAFGDLSPEEAARVEAETQLDPEAARTYDVYRRMKSELQLLSDVPQDQLSTERLREAILARGLVDRPVRSRPTWLWMPAVAALAAFTLVFVRGNMSHPKPMVTAVVDKTSGTADFLGATKLVTPKPNSNPTSTPRTPVVVDNSPSEVVAMNTEPARRSRRHRYPEMNSRGNDPMALEQGSQVGNASAESISTIPTEALTAPDTSAKTAAAAVAPAPRPEPVEGKPTLVVIQPETDSQTGTHKATEVSNAADVIVGG